MKKLLSVAILLAVLFLQTLCAQAETKTESVSLVFEGSTIACRPIAFTHNDVGEFVLIMHIEGLKRLRHEPQIQRDGSGLCLHCG